MDETERCPMTDFFEIFAPSTRHWREQQEHEKQLVVEVPSGDPDREGLHIDLDRGIARLVRVDPPSRPEEPAAEA